jgi:hypothetical protein
MATSNLQDMVVGANAELINDSLQSGTHLGIVADPLPHRGRMLAEGVSRAYRPT